MRTSVLVFGLSTWTLGGCSQEFQAKEELKDPTPYSQSTDQEQSSIQTTGNSQPVGLSALEASFQKEDNQLTIRYHVEDRVVVALCADTQDSYETCIAEVTNVSQTIVLSDVATDGKYRISMIDLNGEQKEYGPFPVPNQEKWQDVIACTSEINADQLKMEARGEKLYIESDEELRVIVCDAGLCDETRGFEGIEVDYQPGTSTVTVQDQYGCKSDIIKNPKFD